MLKDKLLTAEVTRRLSKTLSGSTRTPGTCRLQEDSDKNAHFKIYEWKCDFPISMLVFLHGSGIRFERPWLEIASRCHAA